MVDSWLYSGRRGAYLERSGASYDAFVPGSPSCDGAPYLAELVYKEVNYGLWLKKCSSWCYKPMHSWGGTTLYGGRGRLWLTGNKGHLRTRVMN